MNGKLTWSAERTDSCITHCI